MDNYADAFFLRARLQDQPTEDRPKLRYRYDAANTAYENSNGPPLANLHINLITCETIQRYAALGLNNQAIVSMIGGIIKGVIHSYAMLRSDESAAFVLPSAHGFRDPTHAIETIEQFTHEQKALLRRCYIRAGREAGMDSQTR